MIEGKLPMSDFARALHKDDPELDATCLSAFHKGQVVIIGGDE